MTRPLLLAALTLMAATLAALTGCGSADADGPSDETPDLPEAPGVRVEVAAVAPSDALIQRNLPAELAGDNDAMLASPQGGYVDRVSVKAGDRVRRGQTIAVLDGATWAAQLEIAEAQAAQAQAEFERSQRLGDALSAQQQLQIATQHRVAQANLKLTQTQAARARVTAPFHGEIAEVMVEQGEVAGPGTPVARLVAADPIIAEVSVSDRDLPWVQEGDAMVLRVQSLSEVYKGTVRGRSVAADTRTRTWLVEVEVPNPEGALQPGMLGQVSFERSVADDQIVIPQDWVVTRLSDSGVFVDVEGTATWRALSLGEFVEDQVVVRGGLEDGDRVVSSGHRSLAEGDALIVVRQGRCCEAGRVVWGG